MSVADRKLAIEEEVNDMTVVSVLDCPTTSRVARRPRARGLTRAVMVISFMALTWSRRRADRAAAAAGERAQIAYDQWRVARELSASGMNERDVRSIPARMF